MFSNFTLRFIIFFCLINFGLFSRAQKFSDEDFIAGSSEEISKPYSAREYIEHFKEDAIKEMYLNKIPASIVLAQAMFESDNGNSELARKARNHFGIKCGKDWDGGTYFKIDDDTDSTGTLVESCFRAFEKAEDSFVAHSDFLTDSRKQQRYGFLFQLAPADYEAWAKGLSAAGYATDPAYPEKLIRIIEKYRLDTLDDSGVASVPVAIISRVEKKEEAEVVEVSDFDLARPSGRLRTAAAPVKTHNMYKIIWVNDSRAIQVTADTDVETLAGDLHMPVSAITAHNEMLLVPSEVIKRGTTVYLENKKRDYEGRITHHIVNEGETIEAISNLYGVQANTLYQLNRIEKGYQPLSGETLALKEKVAGNKKPKVARAGKKTRGVLFSQL